MPDRARLSWCKIACSSACKQIKCSDWCGELQHALVSSIVLYSPIVGQNEDAQIDQACVAQLGLQQAANLRTVSEAQILCKLQIIMMVCIETDCMIVDFGDEVFLQVQARQPAPSNMTPLWTACFGYQNQAHTPWQCPHAVDECSAHHMTASVLWQKARTIWPESERRWLRSPLPCAQNPFGSSLHLGNAHTPPVSGIHNHDDCVCAFIVGLPGRPQVGLAPQIPHLRKNELPMLWRSLQWPRRRAAAYGRLVQAGADRTRGNSWQASSAVQQGATRCTGCGLAL